MADETPTRGPQAKGATIGAEEATRFESVQGSFPFVSWRSIIAGVFITLLTYATLMSLGLAVGGNALENFITEQEGGGLRIGSAIWLILSTLVALFAGGYFAARISNYITPRIGAAQGLIISSLFFVLFLWQLGGAIGSVGGAVGSAGRAVGGQAGNVVDLAQNPQVQDVIERSLGGLNLRSEPQVVIQGLMVRLLRGNTEGAKNYLANQAGISPEEADRRLAAIRNDFTQTMETIGATTARVLSRVGWSLFGMMVLGTIASTLGGGLGSRENLRHPISVEARARIGERVPAGV